MHQSWTIAGIVIGALMVNWFPVDVCAQQITGGSGASERTMNIYTISSGGGATGDVHATTAIPSYFGSIGQPFAYSGTVDVSGTPKIANGAGVMNGVDMMFSATTSAATLPTAQPSGISFSVISPTSFTVSFFAANPAPVGYLVLRTTGSSGSDNPSVGVTYTIGGSIGLSTVVSVGPVTNFNQTGLTPGTTYYYRIFSYNGAGPTINYLTTNPHSGSQTTYVNEPSSQPSLLSFSLVTPTSFTVSFAAAPTPPTGYIVIRGIGSQPTGVPVDGIFYAAGASTGNGTGTVVSVLNSTTFNEAGLTPSTTYYYIVYAFNGSGSAVNYYTSVPAFGSRDTPSLDSSSPDITHNSLNSVAQGANYTIRATVQEPQTSVASVTVAYRSVAGNETPTPGTMTLVSGNANDGVWEFTVPSSQIGELGLDYQITATNSVPLSKITTLRQVVINHSSQAIPYTAFGTAVTNYRIISIPLILNSNKVSDIFNSLGEVKKDWRLYHYQNSSTTEMTSVSSLDPGQGYWLIVKNAGSSILAGQGTTVTSTATQPFTITLANGWNQIGNPYLFNVMWADVKAASNLNVALRTYGSSGYESDAVRLNRFEGAFIFAPAGGTLVFPVLKNPLSGGRMAEPVHSPMVNSIDQLDWEVKFKLVNGNTRNEFGGVGMRHDASASYDVYDDFTMPRFIEYLELNQEKELHRTSYAKDIVPSQENHTWNFVVESNLTGQTEMTWDNSFFGDNERQIFLMDTKSQLAIDMRKADSYKFEGNRSFKVVYGNEAYVKEHTSVNALVVHQVYPNPTQGKVTIAFSIPADGGAQHVVLKVSNQWGQAISTVLSGPLAPGYHEVEWTGVDSNGLKPAQGLYLMQLSHGAESKVERIIIK